MSQSEPPARDMPLSRPSCSHVSTVPYAAVIQSTTVTLALISAQVADIGCVQQQHVRRDQCFPLDPAPLRGRGIVQETAKLVLDPVMACTGAGRLLHVRCV